MKSKKFVITKRDFLRGTVGAALGATLVGPEWIKGMTDSSAKSDVYIVRDQNATDDSMAVNKKVLEHMMQQLLNAVTGENSVKDNWLKMAISPEDIIGLVPTPHMNPTHDELIEIVTASLVEAGIPAENIRNAQGRSVDLESITALISIPGLKGHWLTGIGTVIKNYILYSGAPRNYHNQNSSKLGEIWNLPQVKDKTRLILVDALNPLCDKGPQVDPRYKWAYNGLIAGTDPVAVEAVCLKIIQAKRDEIRGEHWPISPPPICVDAADKVYNLGTSDLSNINIKTIGWTEDLLV